LGTSPVTIRNAGGKRKTKQPSKLGPRQWRGVETLAEKRGGGRGVKKGVVVGRERWVKVNKEGVLGERKKKKMPVRFRSGQGQGNGKEWNKGGERTSTTGEKNAKCSNGYEEDGSFPTLRWKKRIERGKPQGREMEWTKVFKIVARLQD